MRHHGRELERGEGRGKRRVELMRRGKKVERG